MGGGACAEPAGALLTLTTGFGLNVLGKPVSLRSDTHTGRSLNKRNCQLLLLQYLGRLRIHSSAASRKQTHTHRERNSEPSGHAGEDAEREEK